MIRKLFATFIVVPLGILLVAFAVANRHAVRVSFDPLGSDSPNLTATAPLFLLILLVLGIGVLAGGAATWLRQGKWRRAARRLDAEARGLRSECATLRAQLAAREQLALPVPTSAEIAA